MYNKKQRIAALIGIVLLVVLYLVTLLCAIFNFDGSGKLFKACLFATIAIPILLWIYIWLYGKMTGKHTIADLDSATQRKITEDMKRENETEETITISKRNKKKIKID